MRSIFKKIGCFGFHFILVAGFAANATTQTKTELDESDVLRRAHVFHIMFAEKDHANLTYLALQKIPSSKRFSEFKKLAQLKSMDPGSKNLEGDLGILGQGQMTPEFDAALFLQPVREVSLPIKSQFGWHLLYVESFTEEPIVRICQSSLEKIVMTTPQSSLQALKLPQNSYSIENLQPDLVGILGEDWSDPSTNKDGDLLYKKLAFTQSKTVTLISHTEYKNAKFDRAIYYAQALNSKPAQAFCTRSTRMTYAVDCTAGKIYYEGYSSYELRGGKGRVVRSGAIKAPQKAVLEAIPKTERKLIESACVNRKIDVDYY